MTRKDYILLAEAVANVATRADLGDIPSHHHLPSVLWAIDQVIDHIAIALEKDNPRFDRERFIQAAWGES